MKRRNSEVCDWVLMLSAGLAAAACLALLGCGRPAEPVEDGAARPVGSVGVSEPADRGVSDTAAGPAKPAESAAGEPARGHAAPKSKTKAKGSSSDADNEWVTIEDVDVSGLDIAVYPGARQEGAANIDNDRVTLVSVNLATSEPYDEVAGFYKARYPSAKIRENVADETRAMIMEISGAPDLRTVRVVRRADTDDVSISLMRQQETEAN